LFGAGFQLSFTIVAALILLAPLLAARWRGADLLEQSPRWKRWAMDYAAVCLVAWAVALPLVCFHFHKISPLAAILTPLMLPVVAVVLWVGYLKMMLTWIDPAIGNWLGLPLGAMADFLAAAVRRSADLPGVVLYTPPVSVLWWIGTSSVVVAWLCGAFVRRRMACIAAITLCIGWLQAPVLQHALFDRATGWRLHTFAVGNGSAYLIDSDGEHLLYDCGSSSFADLTGGLLDPALRSAGVRTIDTLVLSHPDLDHFSGAIALIERFGVRRVLLTEAFIAEESNDQNLPARTAVGALMRELRRLPVEIQIVAAKRSWQLGHCQLDILWPPAGQTFSQRNDGSIVMSIRGAGRRLLLTGDIQDRAMRSLLGSDQQLHADIMELPHHGSLAAKTGPRWLQTVEPLVAIQSTSMGPRVRNNPWGQYLRDTHLCATARGGAVRLVVDPAGTMDLSRYREQGWKPTGTYTYNKGRYQRPSGADE
jgi:competence protein ComEC